MIKECAECKEEFECYDRPYQFRSSGGKAKRSFSSKTCSSKCSKKYQRKAYQRSSSSKLKKEVTKK